MSLLTYPRNCCWNDAIRENHVLGTKRSLLEQRAPYIALVSICAEIASRQRGVSGDGLIVVFEMCGSYSSHVISSMQVLEHMDPAIEGLLRR
jgi:hypothetical protein